MKLGKVISVEKKEIIGKNGKPRQVKTGRGTVKLYDSETTVPVEIHVFRKSNPGITELCTGMVIEFQEQNRQFIATRIIVKPPYNFVSIAKEKYIVKSITDTPIFHDGNHQYNSVYSGEILCTIRALTPLLVGNDQYEVVHIHGVTVGTEKNPDDPNEKEFEGLLLPSDNWKLPFTQLVDKAKSVLEPLRHTDGRVLISGSSLKGMLRHSLDALLSAPMERVAERTYSYRPGAQTIKGKRASYPAIVEGFTADGGIKIRVLKQLSKNDLKFFDKKPYVKSHENCYHYSGGLDGKGLFHKAFAKSNKKKFKPVKQFALVTKSAIAKNTMMKTLSKSEFSNLFKFYNLTHDHLVDKKDGHLRGEHPLRSEKKLDADQAIAAINGAKDSIYKKHQLIYVELENDDKVVSLGHSFRYRWRHMDTVRTRWSNGHVSRRSVVNPLLEEQQFMSDGPYKNSPKSLSGGRLLFGYVSEQDTTSPQLLEKGDFSEHSGTQNIGKENFKKYAGRLAFNIAVEHISPDKAQDNNRFLLSQDESLVIPLKILGTPRPSAMEFYLEQNSANHKNRKDGGSLVTYGDIFGEPSGELNGRKFYPHQPDTANNPALYEAQTKEIVRSKQATLARFVSKPDTQFRFTLRFRDLRPWELGALVIALEPARLFKHKIFTESYQRIIQEFEELPEPSLPDTHTHTHIPLFAHKLGHGRPLGLGSVHLQVDSINKENGTELDTTKCEIAFIDKINSRVFHKTIEQWLKVHQYRGRDWAAYPEEDGTIYNFHSNLRNRHLKQRKLDHRKQYQESLILPKLNTKQKV